MAPKPQLICQAYLANWYSAQIIIYTMFGKLLLSWQWLVLTFEFSWPVASCNVRPSTKSTLVMGKFPMIYQKCPLIPVLYEWSPALHTHRAHLWLTRFYDEKSCCDIVVNTSPPSAAYMRQWIGSAIVQIMVCRLFGTKSLSKPTLGYCQWDL